MFKINKDTRTTSVTSFWCFFVNFEHITQLFLALLLLSLNMAFICGIRQSEICGKVPLNNMIKFFKEFLPCILLVRSWLVRPIHTKIDPHDLGCCVFRNVLSMLDICFVFCKMRKVFKKKKLMGLVEKEWCLEAVVQSCSVKKVFIEISQNSQENTCARDSFLIKLQAEGLQLC